MFCETRTQPATRDTNQQLYTRWNSNMHAPWNTTRTKRRSNHLRKALQLTQLTRPWVINSVKKRHTNPSTVSCRSSQIRSALCMSTFSASKRDSRSVDLLLMAASNPLFAEKKGSFSVFRHATLPRPAILCPALFTPIFHTSFSTTITLSQVLLLALRPNKGLGRTFTADVALKKYLVVLVPDGLIVKPKASATTRNEAQGAKHNLVKTRLKAEHSRSASCVRTLTMPI